MSFASWTFVLGFLPITLLLFRYAGSRRQDLLILASALFYAWSGLWNATIFAASIIVNIAAGHCLTAGEVTEPTRKRILWLAVAANVGLLAGFKIAALDRSQTGGYISAEQILIPLALSFITFQQIGFITACYRRTVKSFTVRDYLLFILFFPQLIMGPIARFRDRQGQLRAAALDKASLNDLAIGLAIFSFGLAQKVILADNIAPVIDAIFSTAQATRVTTVEAWGAIVGFQLQIYFDFAGYADMAIGLGRMFGIALPINFDRPLFARDRFDVWRRWHITFATFMRNHVFVPLAHDARWPIVAALAMTGILSGLWHGLGWTFVVWGLLQAALLLGAHWRRQRQRSRAAAPLLGVAAIILTFAVTSLVGGLFRSPTLLSAGHIYGALLGLAAAPQSLTEIRPLYFAKLVLCAIVGWGLPNSAQLFRQYWTATDQRMSPKPPLRHPLEGVLAFRPNAAWAVGTALLLGVSLALLSNERRFIYVQF